MFDGWYIHHYPLISREIADGLNVNLMDPEEVNLMGLDQQRMINCPRKTLSKHTPTLWIYQLAVESPHCQYVNHGKSSTRNKWAIVHIAI